MSSATFEVSGRAVIDDRPASWATLTISPDGTWRAEVATFTLAGEVDVFLTSEQGGQFVGPAAVLRSRADTHPLAGRTELQGIGPILIGVAADTGLELPSATVLVGEVAGE